MGTKGKILMAVLFLALCCNSFADELYVPGQYGTIQEAIDDANDGDTVIVADGTYTGEGNRDIDFKGKAITVRSENGPEHCIIDCNGTEDDRHRGFKFHSGEDANSILDGFAITNGYAPKTSILDYWYHCGGAIFCDGSSPTITNCNIYNNISRYYGGGIYCYESSPTISNCIVADNSAFTGSGICVYYRCSPTITNCILTRNSILCELFSDITIENCSISEGAISGRYSKLRLTNCSISGSVGIGIYCVCCILKMANCSITDNMKGGIHCLSTDAMIIINCTISGNSAGRGGGIYSHMCRPTLINCTFSNNSAMEYGGAIFFHNKAYERVNNCTFSSNSAGYGGGAIYFYGGGYTVINNCTFSGNSSNRGGSIYNYNNGNKLMLTNCIFNGNWATLAGGGIYNSDAEPILDNCTFAQNSSENGNALACYSWRRQKIIAANCIFADGGDEIRKDDYSRVTIIYSNVEGDYPGLGNIDADPCFVELGYWDVNNVWVEGDYHLLAESPCIDSGDPNFVPEPNETDLDGNPRVVDGDNDGNSVVDMGAYEWIPGPVDLIAWLLEEVGGLELPGGIENSLMAKLNSALGALEDENENNDSAAINSLEAFINVVEAQHGKKIPEVEADALIAAAQQIIDLLSDGQMGQGPYNIARGILP